MKKVSGSTTTVYIFSRTKVIAEYDNGAGVAAPSREYIYSGSALVARIESGATSYYHQDQLSNRLVTDSSGNVSAQLGHYPFGESWYNTSGGKLLFTTYERDGESGNDYAMARSYVNRLGRFSSPDQVAGTPGEPQSWNRYGYTSDDPVNRSDPTGHVSQPAGIRVPMYYTAPDTLGCEMYRLRGTSEIGYWVEGMLCGGGSPGGGAAPDSHCSTSPSANSRQVLLVARDIGGPNGTLSGQGHPGLVFNAGSNIQPDNYVVQGFPTPSGGLQGASQQATAGWWQTFRMAQGANWSNPSATVPVPVSVLSTFYVSANQSTASNLNSLVSSLNSSLATATYNYQHGPNSNTFIGMFISKLCGPGFMSVPNQIKLK